MKTYVSLNVKNIIKIKILKILFTLQVLKAVAIAVFLNNGIK